ncbi:M28 family metallopeptidase [Streptomyces sp. GC420]|uniref:M28 family metallopeptidase n=1 Tax=Streptomyces sp. GC420 TaxID=2697568 RepID=UPI001414EA31|nr:M28 family metallopeptidase [Streptomyces sp. GC420]NBM16459.1 M20/M25/M40 family metallo-hydrolase [Streptomyces sp. GC420]
MAGLAAALTAPLLLAAAPSATTTATGDGHPGHHRDPARHAAELAGELVAESSARDGRRHLRMLQALADANGGNRAAGTPGHEASAAYVHKLLKRAGYEVSYQPFEFTYLETLAEELAVVSPKARDIDIVAMSYTKNTPEGGIRAPLAPVSTGNDATPGCEAGDYAAGAYRGKIALIRRGGCSFTVKQEAAARAGAVAAVIHNNTRGPLHGTLGEAGAARIPTGGITREEGRALAAEAAKGTVTVSLEIRQLQERRRTRNVIAETRGGDPGTTVVLGAHLDSVTEGPGINDNGSGSAGLLEVALELAEAHPDPANKVRFAWWSAEELGLLGSEEYVSRLTKREREQIRLYLNFDMIASPNYGLFVYDGDDSDQAGAGPGPEGSAQLERDITDFLDSRGLPHEGTDFSGRSDYGPFIEVGIPAGGTFTGAEGIKTAEQAAKFGGTAGLALDPCYHKACDDIGNIDMRAFGINIDVIANAVGTYAYDLSSLTEPVASVLTGAGAGKGGGLHDDDGPGIATG